MTPGIHGMKYMSDAPGTHRIRYITVAKSC